jgi:hypothetical protein
MLKHLRQARAAFSMLNPDEVRKKASRRVNIGLVASNGGGYAAMEDFLAPAELPHEDRLNLMDQIHRAGHPGAPDHVDLVIYQAGLANPEGTYGFDPLNPAATIDAIVKNHDDVSLSLARQFPAFRRPVVEQTLHAVARENAMFAITTALPNIIPNLIELPWAIGEFASDTAFLTANQVRMAFMIAAACGKEVGYANQTAEIVSIAGGAFGWRALARELAGKIPLGGGLVVKGAIAYAGTMVVGKGLEYLHCHNRGYSAKEREVVYQQAYERGKSVSEGLAVNRS